MALLIVLSATEAAALVIPANMPEPRAEHTATLLKSARCSSPVETMKPAGLLTHRSTIR
jgi:hypothetical protein